MEVESRVPAAWWGPFIADALAMPAHWYYQRHLIPQDYGLLETYRAPLDHHPDSILWRSSYQSTGPKDDILHEQSKYWGLRDVHYHQFLQRGENTLNLKLATLLAESLREHGAYSQKDYLDRYIDFLLTPGKHRDTYIEEYHRGFFQNYARGKAPEKCGISDEHIGGLATLVPLIVHYRNDPAELDRVVQAHVSLTHKHAGVLSAARGFAMLLSTLMAGGTITEALHRCGPAAHPSFSLPFGRWAETLDESDVIGRKFSPACYIGDAFPASIFLAVKYEGGFREGVTANTFLGGDNCHRGVVVGALLGAAGGLANIPPDWITGLHDHPALAPLVPVATT